MFNDKVLFKTSTTLTLIIYFLFLFVQTQYSIWIVCRRVKWRPIQVDYRHFFFRTCAKAICPRVIAPAGLWSVWSGAGNGWLLWKICKISIKPPGRHTTRWALPHWPPHHATIIPEFSRSALQRDPVVCALRSTRPQRRTPNPSDNLPDPHISTVAFYLQ